MACSRWRGRTIHHGDLFRLRVEECSICANVLPLPLVGTNVVFVGTNVLLCNHLMCGIWCYGFCIKGLFFCVVKSLGFCVKSSCSSEVS